MRLLVVIVCYKVADLTISCLRSLEVEVAALPGTKVAVCENGTGGDAFERLEKAIIENGWSSWVELTLVMPNRGFTGGNNHVIGPALEGDNRPDYVLLLNADTEVHPGALRELVEFMETHPRAGAAGSRLVLPDGGQQSSPFYFEGIATQLNEGMRLGIVTRLLRRWVRMPTPNQATLVDWVSGASMIIRRKVFEQIGMLDEGYYTYFDDIDYCLNAKRAGWEVWYVPSSRVMHLEGVSTEINHRAQGIKQRRPPYWFQARRRYFLKNYGAFYTACVDAAYIFGQATWRLRRIIQRKTDPFPPSLFTDTIRNSVYLTGFKLRDVENPAMKKVPLESQPANRMNHATE